ILYLVSRECVQSNRRPSNLFCVGDVKQSIYRFRLADPQRFLDREARYRSASAGSAEVIDLSGNFRSRGPLLSAVNFLFERVMSREAVEIEYHQTHRLTAMADYPEAQDQTGFNGAPIEVHLLPALGNNVRSEGHGGVGDSVSN